MSKDLIVGLILGAGAGSAITYFVTKKVLLKKYQQFADDQIREMRDHYQQRKKELSEVKSDENREEQNEQEGTDLGFDEIAKEEFRKDYSAVSTPDDGKQLMKRPDGLPPTAVDTPDGYPDIEDDLEPPYLIREKDFGDAFSDIAEWVLWSDGVVTSDNEIYDIIDPDLVNDVLPKGWKNMFNWDKTGTYENQLYFRNNKLHMEISVIKQARSFEEWKKEAYPSLMIDDDDDEYEPGF